MKAFGASLLTLLSSRNPTLAVCLKISLKDGTVFGYTNYDSNITHDGRVYYTKACPSPSKLVLTDNIGNVSTYSLEGYFYSSGITRVNAIARKYDDAEVELFITDYTDPTDKIILHRGWVGEFVLKDEGYEINVDGIEIAFQMEIGDLVSPVCRATLGDEKCKVSLSKRHTTISAPNISINQLYYRGFCSVATVTSNRIFTATFSSAVGKAMYSGMKETDHYFQYGSILWLDSSNGGLKADIKEYTWDAINSRGNFELFAAMPFVIPVASTFTVIVGCDQSPTTCQAKFNNFDNYQGEYNIPLYKITQYAITKIGEVE